MNWGSLDEFLAMGGYGFYVWGSYGVAALCASALEILSLKLPEAKQQHETTAPTHDRHRRRASRWSPIAAALVLNAFQSNLVFFFSPSQVAAKEAPLDRTFRIGGMVEKGSLKRRADGLTVRFRRHRHGEEHSGGLHAASCPTCSRRARAWWRRASSGPTARSTPSEVLAKHDENYMPPEAAHALSKAEADKAAKSVVYPRRQHDDSGNRPFRADPRARARAGAGRAAARRRGAAAARPGWRSRGRRRRASSCSSPSPSAASPGRSTATISRCSTWRATPTPSCRRPTASPRPGAATKARCCCGC